MELIGKNAKHQRAYRQRKKREMAGLQEALQQCQAEKLKLARLLAVRERERECLLDGMNMICNVQPDAQRPLLVSVQDARIQEIWDMVPPEQQLAWTIAYTKRLTEDSEFKSQANEAMRRACLPPKPIGRPCEPDSANTTAT